MANSPMKKLLPDEHSVYASANVFRPIQYLGSKIRVLPHILSLITSIIPPPAKICDLFSGTSVVSQALSQAGFDVVASDVQIYAYYFAHALLRQGEQDVSKGTVKQLLEDIELIKAEIPNHNHVWQPWLEVEQRALREKDANALIALARQLPQVWRTNDATREQSLIFGKLQLNRGQRGTDIGQLISSYYAGTYFGLTQALELDNLRLTIATLAAKGAISDWQQSVLMTALLSAASDSAFSPGKHFAQPHLLSEDKDLTFFRGRILSDRSINIYARFTERVQLIFGLVANSKTNNMALAMSMEQIIKAPQYLDGVKLIYADPPYTAQQYSRFYHVLETLANYDIPVLQTANENITRGLYPINRFKSRFCSKTQAFQAFEDLARLAISKNAHLVISYSGSTGRTGNARMIALEQLLNICSKHFGQNRVSLYELDLNYRQFNSGKRSISGKSVKEYLIKCEIS